MLSGGAALSRSTQEFLSTALVTTLQGYGLTETVGMCCILPPDFWSLGPSGVPVPSSASRSASELVRIRADPMFTFLAVEVKLVDVPDAGYLSTNKLPQGEILCRGPSLFQGYFKRPDLDKEAFTEDGWFRTGDVAQFNADGTMSIIECVRLRFPFCGPVAHTTRPFLEQPHQEPRQAGRRRVHRSRCVHSPLIWPALSPSDLSRMP